MAAKSDTPAVTTFEHDGRTFVTINGKTMLALRLFGSRDGYSDEAPVRPLYFAQVTGRSPLTNDDRPAGGMTLLRSKSAGTVVYTLWKNDLFNYGADAEKARWLFVAPTYAGAWFLALRQLVKRRRLEQHITGADIARVAGELADLQRSRRTCIDWEGANDIAGGERGVIIKYSKFESRRIDVLNLFGIDEGRSA